DLADHLLPHLGMLAEVVRGHRVERQPASLQAVVVTRCAISTDERVVSGDWCGRGARRWLLSFECEQEAGRQHDRHGAGERHPQGVVHLGNPSWKRKESYDV